MSAPSLASFSRRSREEASSSSSSSTSRGKEELKRLGSTRKSDERTHDKKRPASKVPREGKENGAKQARAPLVLTHWCIQRARPDSCQVYLSGRTVGSSQKPSQAWGSSIIKDRVDARLLKTSSGNLYQLEGPPNKKDPRWALPCGIEISDFQHGFPSNWHDIFAKWSSEKRTAQPSKQKKRKPNPPKNDRTTTSVNDKVAIKSHAKPIQHANHDAEKKVASQRDEVSNSKAQRRSIKKRKGATQASSRATKSDANPYEANEFLDSLNMQELDEPVRPPCRRRRRVSGRDDRVNESNVGGEKGEQDVGDKDEDPADDAAVRRSRRLRTKGSVNYREYDSPAARQSLVRHANVDQADSESESESESESSDEDESVAAEARELVRGPRNGEWTAKENRLLREGHARADPTHAKFWSHVAHFVPGRTAQQCYNQWFLNTSQGRSALDIKRGGQTNNADQGRNATSKEKREPGRMRKLAGRNTAKFRGQVREVFRASERDHTDDLFAATPFRKRLAQGKTRAESRDLDNAEDQAQSDESDFNFDFDTSIATPNPKALASAERPAARRGLKGKGSRAGAAQDEGASVDVRVAGESEGEDDQDDLQYINEEERRRADRYIAGVAKRRKVAGRHLRGAQAGQRSESAAGSLTPQMGQTKAKVDTEAVLDDGIKGNFTPGGSVRISVRPEHFVYEFSDEDEGFDDDDDDDDDEEAEE